MDRSDCGHTKGCLFKPTGCDPHIDCTISLMFFVDGPNSLRIQMMAQSLLPPVPLQYIAMAFSKDEKMGDDMVTECILSTESEYVEPEIFISYNTEKANDRTYLEKEEQKLFFHNISGDVIDGRLYCQYSQQIVPQFDSRGGRIVSLGHKYFIMGATGTAQPDELNAHDTSIGSHFYPIISTRMINPSLVGKTLYDLPRPFKEATTPQTAITKMVSGAKRTSVILNPYLLIFILATFLLT